MTTQRDKRLEVTASVSITTVDDDTATLTPVDIDNKQTENDNKLHDGHMHISSTSANYSVINFNTIQRPKHRWMTLLINQFFLSRIIMIFMSVFILFLCISYGMGQILTLKLEEYFCPHRTLKEIRDRSIKEGLNHGQQHGIEARSCWTTKTFAVSRTDLWSQQSYGYESDYSPVSTLKSAAFWMLGIILIAMIIYFIIMLIIDMRNYRNGRIGKKSKKLHKKSGVQRNNNYCVKFWALYSNITSWYSKTFGVDTGAWCLKKVIGEIVEILLQSQALLLYNGTNFNDENDVYLAYQPQFIILFSIFVCLNCISCSILWLFYAFRPQLCDGILFESILSSMDIVYDTFYAIFPILTVLSNKSFIVSLASLQTTTALSFWATFVPMIFLVTKCWNLSQKLMKTMRNHFMTILLNQQYVKSSIQMTAASTINIMPRTGTLHSYSSISWILRNQTIGKQLKCKDYLCHIYTKKIMLIILSLIFTIYGIINIISVTSHFDHAISFCNEIVVNRDKFAEDLQLINISNAVFESQELLNERPELFLWDFCDEKVYPFDSICDCRIFQFRPNGMNIVWGFDEIDWYFNISIVDITESVLRKFKMLEKFAIKEFIARFIEAGDEYTRPPLLDLTADLFVAKHLRVLEIERVDTTGYVDDAIINLKKLEYVSFWESNINILPLTISNLTNIQYFKIGNNRYSTTLPSICKWSKLRALIVTTADITEIPHCITNFKSIEIIQLKNLPSLEHIPLNIFNIPSLKELNLEKSFSLTIDRIMKYDNIADDDQFNDKFEYNDNGITLYDMAESGLCSFSSQNLAKFELFLNKTKACTPVCATATKLDQYACRQYEYQNGVCDIEECKSFECKWDGGDCHQLCECDNYWERLGDGSCDLDCNTTHCNYDEYDCLPLMYNSSICNATYKQYGCLSDWVLDGWCDINCQISKECYFDGDDCFYGGCHRNCLKAFDLFKFAANAIINDNKISVDEFCSVWVFIKDDPNNNGAFNNNCTQIMQYDVNNDNLISFHEIIIGVNEWFDVDQEKANQIDCQFCLNPHPEDYF